MPRPRVVLRRLLRQAGSRPQPGGIRQASSLSYRSRPSLPFLSSPPPQQQFRYLTTERKRWLKHEIITTARYTIVLAGISVFALAAAFVLREEAREREHPTPHDWSFMTRALVREALTERARPGVVETDWVSIFQLLRDAIRRLEDPTKDGKGLADVPLGEEPPHPPGSKDLSSRNEEWRRGYYEVLMALAKASEHVDGFVLDTTRNIAFPPELMIGPSNPRPRPIPPGSKPAPLEENCVLAFKENPDELYQRILGTRGFTNKQRMDAALAYASWLEYKGVDGPALIMYEEAVKIALGSDVPPPSPTGKARASSTTPKMVPTLDPKTWTLNDAAGLPSANLLSSLTAYATFRARQGDVASALPIMASILRARRSLPNPGADDQESTTTKPPSRHPAAHAASAKPTSERDLVERIADVLIGAFSPPPYPDAPDDGSAPPPRDSKGICEEAALHMHIGEVMYSAGGGSVAGAKGRRDDGLAWTREAVDMAEEQLHKLESGGGNGIDSTSGSGNRGGTAGLARAIGLNNPFAQKMFDPREEARRTCKQCLTAGLDNWQAMVSRLAREEEARRRRQEEQGAPSSSGSSWFGLWGDGRAEEEQRAGRWAAEEKVVAERRRRAQRFLDESEAPPSGIMSLFWT